MMPHVVNDADIATHANPARRDRAKHIVRLDLADYRVPGKYEQMWTRSGDGDGLFELCCVPFFPDGLSLGDVLEVDTATGAHQIRAKSGHRTIRIVFVDDRAAHAQHVALHMSLVGDLCCQVEFRAGNHYAAVDLPPQADEEAVIAFLLRSQHPPHWSVNGQTRQPPSSDEGS